MTFNHSHTARNKTSSFDGAPNEAKLKSMWWEYIFPNEWAITARKGGSFQSKTANEGSKNWSYLQYLHRISESVARESRCVLDWKINIEVPPTHIHPPTYTCLLCINCVLHPVNRGGLFRVFPMNVCSLALYITSYILSRLTPNIWQNAKSQTINHQSQRISSLELSDVSPPVLYIMIFVPFKVEESPPQRIWDRVQRIIPHDLGHLAVAQARSWIPVDLDPLHDDCVEVLQVEELEVDEEAEEEDHLHQILHVDHFLWMAISCRLSFDEDFFDLRLSGHLIKPIWDLFTLSCFSSQTKASFHSLRHSTALDWKMSCLFDLPSLHL